MFLIGTVDLPERAWRALRGLGDRLHVLCIARPADADRFDPFGAVIPERWVDRAAEVPLERIDVVDRPIDQAEAVVARVAGIAGDGVVDPDRIALVLADERLAPVVGRELAHAGAPAHDARGIAAGRLAPARALERLANHLRQPGTATLRALLSEPDFERAVLRRGGVDPAEDSALAALDRWREDHHDRLLDDAGASWGAASAEFAEDRAADASLLAGVDGVVRELCDALRAPRTIGAFARPLLALLGELFADALVADALVADDLVADDRGLTDAALAAIRDQLASIAAVPAAIQPMCDGADAIGVLIAMLSSVRVREEPHPDELELIGWLELPFDPAAAAVVVGMNDGCVPSSSVDSWFPDALRRAVALPDERRRVARDSWLLSIANARRAAFVVGRRDAAGEPLAPSRLLMTGHGEALARRVLALTEPRTSRIADGSPGSRRFGPPPPPSATVDLDEMRVTAFARYLQSPYHFWVEQMRRLRSPEPAGDELDARGFGTVVHAVLEVFGRSEDVRDLMAAAPIERFLDEQLDRELHVRAGGVLGPGLQVQRRILRERLGWFAERHAALVREGWRIHAVEHPLSGPLAVPDEPAVTLIGKVDRIDHHAERGVWRILDYKTSDTSKRPDRAHRGADGGWRDLQLPLYQYLFAAQLQAVAPAQIELGYFNFGASSESVGVALAKRLAGSLDEALAEARRIVRDIRAGKLELPARPPKFQSESMAILTRVAALVDDGASDEEGDA